MPYMIGAMALGDVGWWVPAEAQRAVEPDVPVEASLARDAVRGDRAAFARLVELNKRVVYGLCLRLLQDREEARDAAQETFVRAVGAIATYDQTQPFAPWLLRIARNHCIDLVRRRLPRSRKVELDADPQGADRAELADVGVRADEQLERAQVASSLDGAVAALPANYREVIHLFHVEHMSYKEIATTMEVPIGTVMTWLHRARARLRELLASKEQA
jgi:RNA polymerase sigma-70 factor (ECF subfamily)